MFRKRKRKSRYQMDLERAIKLSRREMKLERIARSSSPDHQDADVPLENQDVAETETEIIPNSDFQQPENDDAVSEKNTQAEEFEITTAEEQPIQNVPVLNPSETDKSLKPQKIRTLQPPIRLNFEMPWDSETLTEPLCLVNKDTFPDLFYVKPPPPPIEPKEKPKAKKSLKVRAPVRVQPNTLVHSIASDGSSIVSSVRPGLPSFRIPTHLLRSLHEIPDISMERADAFFMSETVTVDPIASLFKPYSSEISKRDNVAAVDDPSEFCLESHDYWLRCFCENLARSSASVWELRLVALREQMSSHAGYFHLTSLLTELRKNRTTDPDVIYDKLKYFDGNEISLLKQIVEQSNFAAIGDWCKPSQKKQETNTKVVSDSSDSQPMVDRLAQERELIQKIHAGCSTSYEKNRPAIGRVAKPVTLEPEKFPSQYNVTMNMRNVTCSGLLSPCNRTRDNPMPAFSNQMCFRMPAYLKPTRQDPQTEAQKGHASGQRRL